MIAQSRQNSTSSDQDDPRNLSRFQRESIAFFVNAATTLSIPRSLGEIYGLLFSTRNPLTLDDLVTRLRISRGSASEGTRWLRNVGAVNLVYVAGNRKDHYTAETSLRKLANSILRNQIEPHVDNGDSRIQSLEESVEASDPDRDFAAGRVTQIRNWYRYFSRALPVLRALAARF